MTAKKTETASAGTALATTAEAGLPAELMGMMQEDAGKGISDNPNDVGIPFIAVLQDMSPQVKKRDEAYIDGAEVGMLFNTVTKELYPHGVQFLPVYYESCHVEWVPRDAGGGFKGKHPFDTPLVRDARPNPEGKGAPRLPNGNDLVETRYWYGFFRPLDAEGNPVAGTRWEPGVIAFSSTGLKRSREWVGMTKRFLIPGTEAVAPLFSHIYVVTTKLEKKNNNEWFLPSIVAGRWVTGDEYNIAKTFHEQAASGAVNVSQPDGAGADLAEDVV